MVKNTDLILLITSPSNRYFDQIHFKRLMEGEKRTVKAGPGHTKVTRLSPKGEVYAVLQMVSKIELICLHILRTLFLTLIPSFGRLLLGLRRDHIIFISPLPPFHFTRGTEVAFPSPLTNKNNNLRDQLGCSHTESSLREAGRLSGRQGLVRELDPAPALTLWTPMYYRVYKFHPASKPASFSQNCSQCSC